MAAHKPRGRRHQSAVRALADHLGIIAEYVDQTGKEKRATSDRTRVALLAAMWFDASSERAAADALTELRRRDRERLLQPVRVTHDVATPISATLPRGFASRVEWELEMTDEEGKVTRRDGRATLGGGTLELSLDEPPDSGYYAVRLTVRGKGRSVSGEQRLIIVPPRCVTPDTLLGGERVVGLTANLYSLRSAGNWGVGDASDLKRLAEWAASIGAVFVGVNPLHALRNRGDAISPYGPVSRVFRNALYVDVEAVPELAANEDARRMIVGARAQLEELRTAHRLDYEAVMALKRPVLEALHATFVANHRGKDTPRGRAYAAYVAAQGEALEDFATWSVIDERERGNAWQAWPPELRDAHGPAVRALRVRERERVDFFRWLQFELDRQLGAAQARAVALGMPIGLYQDLAIGVAADGSDTWMRPHLFLDDVTIGAPPDPYAAEGQNWGLPAINPHQAAADGYAYWAQLVRAGLRHSGALRIDHVIGLFRQFWIPRDRKGRDGAYVRFPAEDLLGILALESVRAKAVIVGEDLGTVPPEVGPALERWGVLSSKVLYFEQARGGSRFSPPSSYPANALATANTHDMPTLAAFWRELDIDLRAQVGALATKQAVEAARRERAAAREALATTLVDEGLWPAGDEPKSDLALRAAVHAFLRRTPSRLLGLSLDDLAGELEPVNLPGVAPDTWPSWTRRMTMSIEDIRESTAVQRALGVERRWVAER
ncbi:MAG: 4-alpha-glucanotransferase [Gemmatimonadota bacterium]|nr:4-alpha-glucanotransferase [Gemmatimonadota bacterium]